MIEFLFIFFPFILAMLNMVLIWFYKLDGFYDRVAADLSRGVFAK